MLEVARTEKPNRPSQIQNQNRNQTDRLSDSYS